MDGGGGGMDEGHGGGWGKGVGWGGARAWARARARDGFQSTNRVSLGSLSALKPEFPALVRSHARRRRGSTRPPRRQGSCGWRSAR
jgi:hypothetical protein